MTRILIVLAACSLLLISGLAHGLWTGRWVRSHAVEDAVTRLEDIPLSVGDWKGTPRDISQAEISSARVDGCRTFRFENRRKREALNVLLVCGKSGPLSVHTPDVCYQGGGYTMTSGPAPLTLGTGPREIGLLTATFRKEDAARAMELQIFWTWNAWGRWQAPANPRWTFARAPALFKLYVIRERKAKDATRPDQDPAVDFLNLFLPELNRRLCPAESGQ